MLRRRVVGRGAGILLAIGLSVGPGVTPLPRPARPASPAITDAQRALRAYQAMLRYFVLPDGRRLRERYPDSGVVPATLWPFSQALVATLSLAGVPGVGEPVRSDLRARLDGLALYWSARVGAERAAGLPGPAGYRSTIVSPSGTAGDLYYDDNAWIGLALVEYFRLTAHAAALERAGQIFQLLVSGWDDDPAHPSPGGVFWARRTDNRDRNTVSTASAAALGAQLYLLTHQTSYLAWATRMYWWVERTLRAPNGLYWDHLDLAGRVDLAQWSYNQGLMVAAALLLSRATDDRRYLTRAEELARQALAHDGRSGGFRSQPVAFNAIFFQNLLRLDAVRPDLRSRGALRAYAEELWRSVDEATGLLRLALAEPTRLLDQAALVQLFALLAGNPEPHRAVE